MIDVNKIDPSSLPSLPLSERDLLPDSCAIYFVIDAGNKLLYIGKANRLRYRWKSHHRLSQFGTLQQVRLAWVSFDPPLLSKELYRIEQECILYFRPPVNNNGKRSLPLHLRTAYQRKQREERYRKNTVSWGWGEPVEYESQLARYLAAQKGV